MAVENRVIFDIKENRFEILSTSTYPTADVSQTVNGVLKLEIDTGSGYSTYYDNSTYSQPNYTKAIDGVGTVGAIDNLIYLSLPPDGSNVLKGNYKFTFSDEYLIATVPTVITQTISFNYLESVNVSACLSSAVSCATPEIAVIDASDYVWNNITPTFETSELVLSYPQTSNQAPLTVSTVPFTLNTNNVWTLQYSALSTVIALYDFTSYLERIEDISEHSFEVICDSLCSLYDCINSLKSEMDSIENVNLSRYNYLLGVYNKAMSIATQVMIAQSCGNLDCITALVGDIRELINVSDCSSDCGSSCSSSSVSERVRGAFNVPEDISSAYIGVGGTNPTNSAEVLALTETLMPNDQFVLQTGATENKFKVCLPPGKVIASVVNRTQYNQNLMEDYILQPSTVPVVIGGVAYNYSIYIMDAAIPYSEDNTHAFTVS